MGDRMGKIRRGRLELIQGTKCLESLVFGKFPCIGRSRGEMALIPVPGNAPWFGESHLSGMPTIRPSDEKGVLRY
jgi:hypothetical protein